MPSLSHLALFILATTASASTPAGAIAEENRRNGTREWWRSQQDESSSLQHLLGFSTRLSVDPGEEIEFKFEQTSSTFSLRIYRLGYYGGLGGRFVHEVLIPAAATQTNSPECQQLDNEAHLVDCSFWRTSARWKVPLDAVTGVYVAVPFIDNQIRGTYIPLIVRQPLTADALRQSGILFKTSDLTWVAYNMYGGWNLYTRRNDSKHSVSTRAKAVSYNRPFTNRFNVTQGGKHQNFLFGSEYAALRWLEKYGYDVSYASCADIEEFDRKGYFSTDAKSLKYKALLSVGHDEYWTLAMRRAFESARNSGIHLLFWSGNEIFWRVQLKVDVAGVNSRLVVARKETIDLGSSAAKGVNTHQGEWTGTFGDPRFQSQADPENSLTGQLFAVNGMRHDAIQVHAGENRLRFWRNTTISLNQDMVYTYETARGLLGYEWDVFSDDCHRPAGLIGLSTTRVIVKNQLAQNFGAAYTGSGEVVHRLSLYRHYGRNGTTALVFGAGTIQWSWGLSSWHDGASPSASSSVNPTDSNVQQASLNLLADMGVQPSALLEELRVQGKSILARQHASTDLTPPSSHILHPVGGKEVDLRRVGVLRVAGTARDNGGGRVAGVEVSLDGGVTWRFANGTYNWNYVHHFPHTPHAPSSRRQAALFSTFCKVKGTDTHVWPVLNQLISDNTSASDTGGGGHPGTVRAPGRRIHITILSRAVDDSGNIETIDERHKRPPQFARSVSGSAEVTHKTLPDLTRNYKLIDLIVNA